MFAICSRSFRPGRGPMRSPWASAAASSTDPVQKKAVPLTDGPLRFLRVFHACGQRPSKGGSRGVKNLINYASGLPGGEAAGNLGGLHQLRELGHSDPPYGLGLTAT